MSITGSLMPSTSLSCAGSTLGGLSGTTSDGQVGEALDVSTFSAVGSTTITGLSHSVNASNEGIEQKNLEKTTNVVDYIQTYNEEQRNNLINQIDELLDKEETTTLKLSKKI